MGFLRNFVLNIPSDRVLGRNSFAFKKAICYPCLAASSSSVLGFDKSLVSWSPRVPLVVGICFPDLRLFTISQPNITPNNENIFNIQSKFNAHFFDGGRQPQGLSLPGSGSG